MMRARVTGRRAARIALYVTVLAAVALIGVETVSDNLAVGLAQQTAAEVARPLASICATDPATAATAGADCAQAVAVARDGVDGSDGPPGRGIALLDGSTGRLIVTFTDGSVADAGQLVGPDGRGIASIAVDTGRLLVTYTDGTALDLGPVVGADGRGIASVDGSTGRLLVTLTDGEVVDAGPLPPGPAGPAGPSPGAVQSVTRTYGDGSTERCERTGGPDTDPELACERTGPPSTPP